MNNNDAIDPDSKLTAQEMSEQLVWERLQNEALAAQRCRLEQEIEEAREKASAEANSVDQWFGNSLFSSRCMYIVMLVFVVSGLAAAVSYVC